jgi:acid phosphatase type 7
MIRIIALILVMTFSLAGDVIVYVTYGLKAQHELMIRYIDTHKDGFVKLKQKANFTVLSTETIPLGMNYFLHYATISNLSSGQEVEFTCGTGLKLYKAKTLDNGPISFCVAGDLYREIKPFKQGIKALAKEEPDFVVFGGDIAYSSHGPSHIPDKNYPLKRYLTFFEVIQDFLKKTDGSLIPIVAVIGNHDYRKGKDEYAYKFFFPAHAKSYLSYDLGPELDLVVLDSGHMAPVAGLQQNFLRQALKQSAKTFKIAAYHIGAYPSVYDYNSPSSKNVRDHFCPIFDEYKVNLAFEHHSHAFKVTHPLKADQINEDGTIYLGDGCFGVKPREPKNKDAFYIEDAQPLRHYYKVEINEGILKVYPKNLSSELIHPEIKLESQKLEMSLQ